MPSTPTVVDGPSTECVASLTTIEINAPTSPVPLAPTEFWLVLSIGLVTVSIVTAGGWVSFWAVLVVTDELPAASVVVTV